MTLERQNLNWVVAPQEFVVTEPAVKLGPDSTADKTAESPKPEYFGMEKFLSMHPNDIKEYLEIDKKGKTGLSKEGQDLALLVWGDILTSTGGSGNYTLENITQAANDKLAQLNESEQSTGKENLLHQINIDVDVRIGQLARVQLEAEIKSGTSPWSELKDTAKATLYPQTSQRDFEDMYMPWVINLKKDIAENVADVNDKTTGSQELSGIYEVVLATKLQESIIERSSDEPPSPTEGQAALDSLLTHSLARYHKKTIHEDIQDVADILATSYKIVDNNQSPETVNTTDSQAIKADGSTETESENEIIKPLKVSTSGNGNGSDEGSISSWLEIYPDQPEPKKSWAERLKQKIQESKFKVGKYFHENPQAKYKIITVGTVGLASLEAYLFSSGKIDKLWKNIRRDFDASNPNSPRYGEVNSDLISSDELYNETFAPPSTLMSINSGVFEKSTRTPTPTETVTVTPTPLPTETPTPTPEPTLTYEEELNIQLQTFEGLDFSNENSEFHFDINLPGGQKVEFTDKAAVYREFSDEEKQKQFNKEFAEKTKPGNNTFSVRTDSYGNVQLEIHSGQATKGSANVDLEVEDLRKLVESEGVDINLTKEQIEEIQTKLEDTVVGSEATITQEDGTTKKFEVVGAGYIPHDNVNQGYLPVEMLRKLNSEKDAEGNELVDENNITQSRYNEFANRNNPALILYYCGRTTDHKQDGWYEWSRYVLFLRPVEDTQDRQDLPEVTKSISGQAIYKAVPYMVSDPQKLDAELKAGVTDERPSFIGYSLKDKNAQTKAEQQLQQEEEIASKNELAETAENLRDAINTAYEKNIKHGQELADELRSALQNTNPELEAELADVVRFTDISDGDTENKNNLLQCGEGVALLSALTNGAFPRVDGWTIYDPENADSNLEDNTRAANTKDLWMDMVTGKPQEEFNIVGSVVNTEGALRFRIDTVDMVEPGDLLVSKEGHIVAVIDKYIDENGVTHLKVFDVNFDEKNGGQARIGDITNENMNQNVAGLSEGQSTQYLAISNY